MKKLLAILCMLMVGVGYASAQHIVSGTVTDSDGNPIPGAKVMIVGSSESVITELDGTFRIESPTRAEKVQVFYAGMHSKTQTVKPDMVIKLTQITWWNTQPETYNWFVSLQGAFLGKGVKNPAFGLMFGRVKTLGWYVKGIYRPGKSTDLDYVSYSEESDLMTGYWTTGKSKRGFYAATAGVLVRLQCPIHLYAGLGYANHKVAWELADGTYAKNTEYSYSGMALDYGLLLRVNRFSVNGGVLMSLAGGCHFIGNVGVGVFF